MSINAAATSKNVENESSNKLNTDHPFWQVIRTVPDFPKSALIFMILRRYCAVILMR